MPRRSAIAKRQRAPAVKPRHPAVLKDGQGQANNIVAVAVSVGERELKFARALADTEERVRTASLNSLRVWLKENASKLGSTELDRLWKALFYCVWMADKRSRISAVIRDITNLEEILGWAHISALFRCMVREWMGIDRHRVDKYYELLNVALEVCSSRIIAASTDDMLRTKLSEFVTCVSDQLIVNAKKGGKGVLMHVLDKWVDVLLRPVLEKTSSFSRNSVHWAWDSLLNPFFPLLKSADGRLAAVNLRFEERVIAQLPFIATSDDLDIPARAKHDMLNRASKAIFAAASDPGTAEDCRERLYKLRTSIKVVLIKLKDKSINDEGDANMPETVPNVSEDVKVKLISK